MSTFILGLGLIKCIYSLTYQWVHSRLTSPTDFFVAIAPNQHQGSLFYFLFHFSLDAAVQTVAVKSLTLYYPCNLLGVYGIDTVSRRVSPSPTFEMNISVAKATKTCYFHGWADLTLLWSSDTLAMTLWSLPYEARPPPMSPCVLWMGFIRFI